MTSSILWARGLTRILAVVPLGILLTACAQPASNGASTTLAAATATAVPAPAQPSTAPSDVQLLFENGSTSLSAASNQKLDAAGWKDLVNQMANNGATATDAEFDTITKYLTASFPAK